MAGARDGQGVRACGGGGDLVRGHRSRHHRALGRAHHRRLGQKDRPAARDARGAHHCRLRGGDRRGGAGEVLPPPRGAHRARVRCGHALPPRLREALSPRRAQGLRRYQEDGRVLITFSVILEASAESSPSSGER
eukprot:scaffold69309_cov65-Phaeocystis_antarctica.AAC.24